MMVTRGEYPSWTACWVRENAPEMSACEATTAAPVPMAIIGYNPQDGTRA